VAFAEVAVLDALPRDGADRRVREVDQAVRLRPEDLARGIEAHGKRVHGRRAADERHARRAGADVDRIDRDGVEIPVERRTRRPREAMVRLGRQTGIHQVLARLIRREERPERPVDRRCGR